MEENNVADAHVASITARLEAVADALETASQQLAERQLSLLAEADAHVGRITATIESREAELERKLADAEERIAQLTASASAVTHAGRKTLPAGVASLLTKQGIAAEGGVALAAGALDGALTSLSIEQRIAVKAELLRAGLLA